MPSAPPDVAESRRGGRRRPCYQALMLPRPTTPPLAFAVALSVGAVVMLTPRISQACGVSGPDGASVCMLAQGIGPKWQASVSGIYTSTRLSFSGGDLKGDQTRSGVMASLGRQMSRQLTVQIGLGPSIGGAFVAPDGRHAFQPGLLGLVGASYRVYGGPELDERGEGRQRNPFVVLTSALSFNLTSTRHEAAGTDRGRVPYRAFDLRFGALVGLTLADRFRPYALARVFGGPVFWRYQGSAVTGTDMYKFQLGGGMSVALGGGFAVFAEGVPLGERGASGGAAMAF